MMPHGRAHETADLDRPICRRVDLVHRRAGFDVLRLHDGVSDRAYRDRSLFPDMTILLPALAIAFAAFCVWLAMRIVNRRERWAKRTLAVTVGLAVLYVASFGPACWLCEKSILPQKLAWIVCRPMTWLCVHGPTPIKEVVRSYAKACGDTERTKVVVELYGPPEMRWFRGSPGSPRMLQSWSTSPIDYEFVGAEYRR